MNKNIHKNTKNTHTLNASAEHIPPNGNAKEAYEMETIAVELLRLLYYSWSLELISSYYRLEDHVTAVYLIEPV
jgi:hypothetical protein